ncbi:MAG: B12-binding domain-containing radical SAM protein [Myxococcales bacterium]|nr:B12-binding domain-containing radical SAM protein [Myxococcales bacterium]
MARIAFCQEFLYSYMSFTALSAALKQAGHQVELFCFSGLSDRPILDDLIRFKPDLVGFSVLTPSRDWSLATAKRIKSRLDTLVIFGNLEAIFHPEVIENSAVDIVCRWEGEAPLLELARRLDRRLSYDDIPGLWVKTSVGIARNDHPGILTDLDAAPFQDLALYDKYSYFRHSRVLPILCGRGCPFNCRYCFNPLLREYYGGRRYLRKRRAERVIEELRRHEADRFFKHVLIVDETMWNDNDWLREFLLLYRRYVHKPIIANYRFGALRDEDFLLMKQAGVEALIVASETGDEEQRRTLLGKNVANEEIIRVCRRLREVGIAVGCSVFFGLPGDRVNDHLRRLAFFRKLNPTYLWSTFFQPYPGLALTADPVVQAALPANVEFHPTYHHDIVLDVPEKERLARLKKIYFLCVKFPRLSSWFMRLTKWDIPLLFSGLFFLHFAYYAKVFERLSFRQYLAHVRLLALKPLWKYILAKN